LFPALDLLPAFAIESGFVAIKTRHILAPVLASLTCIPLRARCPGRNNRNPRPRLYNDIKGRSPDSQTSDQILLKKEPI
jgi:hypothetical protein